MKTLNALLIVIFALVAQVKSAVTVTNITKSEFENAIASNAKVFEVRWVASAGFNPEIVMSASTTDSKDHVWSHPEPVTLIYDDDTGNLNLQVGSTSLTVPIVDSFNTVVFQIQDGNQGVTEFTNFTFNGNAIRNLFADDPSMNDYAYDHIQISNFGETLSVSGNWDMGEFAGGTDSYMRIYAFHSEIIPEPSTIMILFSSLLLLSIRRR